jgi:alpha-L-fucosidase
MRPPSVRLLKSTGFFVLLLSAWALGSARAERNIRLPSTDVHWRQVESYIEAEPEPGYRHASEAAYEAFRDMKFGVRLHWGLYSIWNLPEESWPFLKMSNERRQEYQELPATWNPQGFDAEEWMAFFERVGMKCFAFTTKHHDGFSLFDTKTRVRQRVNWTAPGGPRIEACDVAYSIMETPFRRDVVAELCAAARRHGLKIDLYFSHPDWYDADFRPYVYHPLQTPHAAELGDINAAALLKRHHQPVTIVPDPTPEESARMIARHRAQLRELLTRYGPIDMMCLDMWLGPGVWPEVRETIKQLRALQPDVMLRARGIGNYGDYYTPERFVPGTKENTDMPWMVIYPLAQSFSYDPDAAHYKGAKWVIDNLVDAVAKGGNFMVGIGPDGDGRFHPAAIAQLEEVGAWLRQNGEAIYATRARAGELWHEGDHIRFTRSKDGRTVYAISLTRPGGKFLLSSVRATPGSTISLLGLAAACPWEAVDGGLSITVPPSIPDAPAYVFKINALTESTASAR